MVNLQKNIQWWWSGGSETIEKPSLAMVPWKKNITIASFEKKDHRWSLFEILQSKKTVCLYLGIIFQKQMWPIKGKTQRVKNENDAEKGGE